MLAPQNDNPTEFAAGSVQFIFGCCPGLAPASRPAFLQPAAQPARTNPIRLAADHPADHTDPAAVQRPWPARPGRVGTANINIAASRQRGIPTLETTRLVTFHNKRGNGKYEATGAGRYCISGRIIGISVAGAAAATAIERSELLHYSDITQRFNLIQPEVTQNNAATTFDSNN